MRKEKGAITLYVAVVCLFLLIVGITAYIGVSNKQAAQIAALSKIEEQYKNTELTVEDVYSQYEGGDIVPVYTPEQFAKVGSGEEVYVEQEGKIYTYSTDKTYMFYGVAEDLTATIKEQLAEQLKEEITIDVKEEVLLVSTQKQEELKNEILSTVITEEYKEPETPRLATNMVAVYWSKDGGVTASIHEEGATPIYSKIDANGNPSSTGTVNPNFIEENWYNYKAGYNLIDTKTSRWANGVTDDGSWWIWIPRYKYKITDKPGVTDTASAGIIDIKFISVNELSGVDGYTTSKNDDGEFITKEREGYIIHPAFEDGSINSAKAQGHSDFVEYNNGEWDSELAGFWIAKYEMSMEDSSGNEIVSTQSNANVEISNTVKSVSKPNRDAWDWIQVGTSYKNGYNYNRTNESHLTKGSEWGATAYLTHGQYGRNGNEVTINTSYITAYVGELGSTTGNIYGVYDMNGGMLEFVAVWDTLSTSGYLTSNGNITLDRL